MASRKFTDSEIRAYARNRHEEKNLRARLQKLKQEFGEFHDNTSKHRSSLIEECRQMRKTSGGSPSAGDTPVPEVAEFDLSNRVSRPWAYSAMETTYNVLYQEAIIPTPKRLGTKGKHHSTKSVKSDTTGIKPIRSRVFSSRTCTTSNSLPLPPYLQKANTSPNISIHNNAGISAGQTVGNHCLSKELVTDSNCRIKSSVSDASRALTDTCVTSLSEMQLATKSSTSISVNSTHLPNPEVTFSKAPNDTDDAIEIDPSCSDVQQEANIGEKHVNYTDDQREYNTKYISLPAVHKIDSEDYQKSVRQRMLRRARSRNEPPVQRLVPPSREGGTRTKADNSQNAQESVVPTKSMSADGKECESAVDFEKANVEVASKSKERELNILKEMDSGLNEALVVKATDYVTYRGKTIHNYIRPEERYKLDPLILKRTQNRMDKLAKESATFLKRVNHENIRVEIAFPRSTRKRLLSRLIDENNFGKGRKIKTGGEGFIQNRVEEFMVSISEYIFKQRVQQEHF